MKTPREILLDRHRAAGPKLDAIREKAVAALAPTTGSATSHAPHPAPYSFLSTLNRQLSTVPWALWRELIFPCRHIWGGLAAVWVVLLLLNLPAGKASPQLAARPAPPNREVLAILREQQEMFVQLLGIGGPSPAVPNKTAVPRSQIFQTITLV